MIILGGKYAIAHFELLKNEYQDAWDSLFSDWLPESGYRPDDRPSFEVYLNNPNDNPVFKAFVDIYIPVIPL